MLAHSTTIHLATSDERDVRWGSNMQEVERAGEE